MYKKTLAPTQFLTHFETYKITKHIITIRDVLKCLTPRSGELQNLVVERFILKKEKQTSSSFFFLKKRRNTSKYVNLHFLSCSIYFNMSSILCMYTPNERSRDITPYDRAECLCLACNESSTVSHVVEQFSSVCQDVA